jgi:hypothetical protein
VSKIKPCGYCEQPIPYRGPRRLAAAKYCSVACMRAAERERNARNGTGRLTKACEVCGAEFSYYASVRPQAAYCSQSCKSIGHGRKMTGRILYGKNSPSTFRKAIRAKFLDRCAICGWAEGPCDVAHIIPGAGDAPENVTMLCPNHHRMYDRGLLPEAEIRRTRVSVLREG